MCYFRQIKVIISLIVSFVFIVGCDMPKHTNTLIFGTNTKVALDVSADITTGNPSITVGYKRQEVVWMPLLANEDSNGVPSKDKEFLYTGKDESNVIDTYSVLASFESKFSAASKKNQATAGGGLAQFFATGLAARILAEKGGAKLVSIRPDDGISEEIKIEAAKIRATWNVNIERIIAYVQVDGKVDKDRLTVLLKDTGLENSSYFQSLPGKDVSEFRKKLEGKYLNNVNDMAHNIK